ncbi:MAG: RDD family protein [Gammaproteobacteria bacterium]|nr:RDD family protein [Gammaproteobacteria bacterium]
MSSLCQTSKQFSELPYAGIRRRLLALSYDILIIAGLWMVYGFFALMLTSAFGGLHCQPQILDYNPCVRGPLFQLGLLLITLGYYYWSWRVAGQTVGMRAWRLILSNANGVQLSWYQCVIRSLVGVVSLACVGAGFLWGLTRTDKASWHDLASHSRMRVLAKKKSV